jgi:hypothetical protein
MHISELCAPLTPEEEVELTSKVVNNSWSIKAQLYIAYSQYIGRNGDCDDNQLMTLSGVLEKVPEKERRLARAFACEMPRTTQEPQVWSAQQAAAKYLELSKKHHVSSGRRKRKVNGDR